MPTSTSRSRSRARKPDREWIDAAARPRRPGGLRRQVSARAVRRHAAAGRDRPGAVVQALGAADGRAVRRARRLHPRGDEPAGRGDLAGDARPPSSSSPTRSTRRCSSPTASSCMSARPGRVAKDIRRAVAAAALARDHGDQGGLRPHQRDQARHRRRAEEHGDAASARASRRRSRAAQMSEHRRHSRVQQAKAGRRERCRRHQHGRRSPSGPGIEARCARCWPSSSSPSSSSAAPSWRCAVFEVPQYIMPTPSLIAPALVTDFHFIAAAPRPHAGRALRRLRHRRHRRADPGRGDHPVPVRGEDHHALHPAAGDDADAGAGAAADPAFRLRLHAADHRRGAGLGADGDDQRRHRLPPGRPRPRSRWPAPTAPRRCRSSGRSARPWRCR